MLFLKKNISQDDTGEEIDAILEEMKILADQFYDQLSATLPEDSSLMIEQYILDAVPAYQFSDEILTGWHLTLEFPEVRKTYFCTP